MKNEQGNKMKNKFIAACVASFVLASGAVAKENNVGIFGTSGKTMGDHTYIDQNSEKAANLRSVLENIILPDGFSIELYALVPDARDMAMAPQGTVLFVGTRKDKVWVVSDRDRDGVADEVKDFAPSLDFDVPNGVQFSKDGFLYVAERNQVRMFPAAEFFYEGPDVVAVDIVPKGQLIPEGEESYNHTARVIDIGPDNKLYISLGQPYNVAPPEKLALYEETGIGGIIRMDRDGANREVYTYGVRNSVGHDFHPATNELWWTDNQVDGMGDDIPPGELNRQTAAGQHFGHPWYGGGTTRTNEYANDTPPEGIIHPAVETTAHCADLGMAFYTGNQFPGKYKNAIFSAQHGSWNRTDPCGARVMVTFIDSDGNATMEPFAEGWLNADGEYDGRPMSVEVMKDGSLLVSDDYAGAIYKITYNGG
jgi:glucose/arabinose dehydrogenase